MGPHPTLLVPGSLRARRWQDHGAGQNLLGLHWRRNNHDRNLCFDRGAEHANHWGDQNSEVVSHKKEFSWRHLTTG